MESHGESSVPDAMPAGRCSTAMQCTKVVLRNLRQRRSCANLEDAHEEGREEGSMDAILALLQGWGLVVDATVEVRLRACRDRETLRRWLLNATRADQAKKIFDL